MGLRQNWEVPTLCCYHNIYCVLCLTIRDTHIVLALGRKPVMLLGAIGDAVPMFTIAMTCDTAFYIPLNTVMGFFDSFVTVAVATFIADVVPAPERAAAYGRMFVPALVRHIASNRVCVHVPFASTLCLPLSPAQHVHGSSALSLRV